MFDIGAPGSEDGELTGNGWAEGEPYEPEDALDSEGCELGDP